MSLFLGSCTNGRLSDLEEVAKHLNGHKVKDGVKAIVVPGSQIVSQMAVEKGLDRIFPKQALNGVEQVAPCVLQ